MDGPLSSGPLGKYLERERTTRACVSDFFATMMYLNEKVNQALTRFGEYLSNIVRIRDEEARSSLCSTDV
jgi:hypothetical protein